MDIAHIITIVTRSAARVGASAMPGMRTTPADIGLDDDGLTRLAHEIECETGLEISQHDVRAHATFGEIVQDLDRRIRLALPMAA